MSQEIINIQGLKKANSLNGLKTINQVDINAALINASTLKRKREPIIIHEAFSEIPQKFVNCLNRTSYVRPHMHMAPNQWELMCWVHGEIIALIFDDNGILSSKILMNENNSKIIEIPPFCYHSFITTDKGAYLEIRNCKYQPTIDRLYSKWSPPEESEQAKQYHERFFAAEVGDQIII
jgi:cupin fold WbuC family metalloprotein